MEAIRTLNFETWLLYLFYCHCSQGRLHILLIFLGRQRPGLHNQSISDFIPCLITEKRYGQCILCNAYSHVVGLTILWTLSYVSIHCQCAVQNVLSLKKFKDFLLIALTSWCSPKDDVVSDPESKVCEHSFIAACNSLRWPHFGCLIKPEFVECSDQFLFGKNNKVRQIFYNIPYSSRGARS